MSIKLGGSGLRNMYIGGVPSHIAMQGPAPDGFYVPTRDDFSSLGTKLGNLGWNTTVGDTYRDALFMPYSGIRNHSDGITYESTSTFYWQCSFHGGGYGSNAFISANTVSLTNGGQSTMGAPIRCFKDKPVAPDSSWITIDDGSDMATPIQGAGIYHNPTLGLISISDDGVNWITMADKNLGATTVYHIGDTLSEANCGKLYQWGNNYGFPYSGTVTTDTTRVDETGYGPGNYYESSTFICNATKWFTGDGYNLRGAVTGIVQYSPINKVTMWANKLPAEYQAVEYIESHGEEYIDTGVPCVYGEQYGIDIDFQRLNEDEDLHYIFGYKGMMRRGLYLGFGSGDFVIFDGRPSGPIGRDYGGFTNYSFTPSTYAYNTRYDFNGNFDTGDVDGEGNLTLFSWYNGIYSISTKLYSCEVKVDGAQVRDFVPCYRKSDGEIGLYDLINNVFYTNNGSGAFTKGTDTNGLREQVLWKNT